MKKYISIIILISVLFSCTEKKSSFEQFTNEKDFTTRILDLNKTIDEIGDVEKGKLVKKDINLLSYAYEIGENNTYIVSYLFDEKGCYEIGIDGNFKLQSEAQNVINGIKKSMNTFSYDDLQEDNNLYHWKTSKGAISIELDYKDVSKGVFLATIFANE